MSISSQNIVKSLSLGMGECQVRQGEEIWHFWTTHMSCRGGQLCYSSSLEG